jgi:hypothetical protein
VLRIRDVYPESELFPSRIRIRIYIKEFKYRYFNPKNCFYALGNRIRDYVHPRIRILIFYPSRNPGVKKGTGSRIRNTAYQSPPRCWLPPLPSLFPLPPHCQRHMRISGRRLCLCQLPLTTRGQPDAARMPRTPYTGPPIPVSAATKTTTVQEDGCDDRIDGVRTNAGRTAR